MLDSSKKGKSRPKIEKGEGEEGEGLTLMTDLKNWPQNLVPLLALVRRVLCVLHLIAELEQSVFQIVEAIRRRFPIARRSYGRHYLLRGGRNGFASERI